MKTLHKPVVIVIWDDADSSSVEVITEENLETYHHPAVMKTIGWLLLDNERGVSLANEVYYEGDKPRWRGLTFVPKALIRSITPFTLSTPRKPKAHEIPA